MTVPSPQDAFIEWQAKARPLLNEIRRNLGSGCSLEGRLFYYAWLRAEAAHSESNLSGGPDRLGAALGELAEAYQTLVEKNDSGKN